MKEELDKHLVALKSEGIIDTWNDRKIIPGKDFEEEIKKSLKTADVFIPVISGDFLSTFYCSEMELNIALERREKGELVVIPVMLRSASWADLPIRKLLGEQVMVTPIDNLGDKGFMAAALKIRTTIEKFIITKQSKSVQQPTKTTLKTSISNLVHFPRNANFIDRPSYFNEIHNMLSEESMNAKANLVVIEGLGGIGKTQIAIEYAWRYNAEYDIVWCIRCEDPTTLESDLKSLCPFLGMMYEKYFDNRHAFMLEIIKRLSIGTKRLLLIFDGVENYETIKEYIPNPAADSQPVHVIITSRNQSWPNNATILRCNLLTEDEAVTFLTRNRPGPVEKEAAKKLAHELGLIPNHIAIAYANIKELDCTIDYYFQDYMKHKPELLKNPQPASEYNKPKQTAKKDLVGIGNIRPDVVCENHKMEDQLNILDDVRALSSIVAYKELKPPLSIGLFGDWGVGKTFFIGGIRETSG